MAMTVMEVFARTLKKHPTQIAIRFKSEKAWHELTWQDYYQTVRSFSRGLASLGLAFGDRVVILGHNCKEWLIADLASIFAGAVPAGIYPTSSPEQCAYIIDHAKATIAVVEDERQVKKLLSIRSQIPSLKSIVMMKGTSKETGVYSWNDAMLKSSDFSEAELDKRIRQQSPKDLATLVYTSGTTSHPKAVMLSHDNLTWMSQTCVQFDLGLTEKDHLISYLPLSHIAEQMTTIHGPMYAGSCVSFAENIEKLSENLKEIRPTLFLGVPRVWEKIQSKMEEKAAQAPFMKKHLLSWAQNLGLKLGNDIDKKSYLSYKIADKLIFSKVRQALGLDRCRLQVTAAAPIAKETLEFFMSLGIPLFELYGMSECTGPATISTEQNFKLGATGTCIRGGEVKIADDGEILIRGRHVFMGYLNDNNATKEAIDSEGFLHSGDIGTIDDEGFLYITGRKKNLIITAGGENIAPEMIENKLKAIPVVEQAVVVGDRRKFLTALVTLSPESLQVLKSKHIPTKAKSVDELSQCEVLKKYIQDEINLINQEIARVQTIKKFRILPQSFSEESGEMTPTMKVKRAFVIKKYQQEIDLMYA